MIGAQLTVISASEIDELIEVASLAARIETRRRISRGEGVKKVRRVILSRLRGDIRTESFGRIADDALLSAVRSTIDSTIRELETVGRDERNAGRWGLDRDLSTGITRPGAEMGLESAGMG